MGEVLGDCGMQVQGGGAGESCSAPVEKLRQSCRVGATGGRGEVVGEEGREVRGSGCCVEVLDGGAEGRKPRAERAGEGESPVRRGAWVRRSGGRVGGDLGWNCMTWE